MNKKDELLQQQLPTLMVPQYEHRPLLKEDQTRFLMAKDGLWIESKTCWGSFSRQVYKSPRMLPYGAVPEITELSCGNIPRDMVFRFIRAAKKAAENQMETAAWITWDRTKGWNYLDLDLLEQSSASVHFTWPTLSSEQYLILDMHSHGTGSAYFSATDNRSDQGKNHFSLVLGNCGNNNAKLEHAFRLCLAGFFFEYPDELPLWKEQ